MNIGIDASRYGHDKATGVELYSFKIINELVDLAEKDKKANLILFSRAKLKISGAKNIVINLKRLWTHRGLGKAVKENKLDVLFVPSHVLPIKLPKRSYIMIHDVAFKYLRSSYSFVQYHYLDWSTKFAVKNATKILVPSEATKRDLINFYNCPSEKIEVVYHGFEPLKFTEKEINEVFKKSDVFKYFGIKKDSKFIFFVGRLESKKNLVRLVEAFAEFSKLNPDYRLVLAGGRGVGFDQLLKTVTQLKIAEKVVMPGYITEKEKAALYKSCALFAFPSLYEGFGFPILEAFYYKKPVLTSHLSCIPEVADDAAHYVDPYDSSSILAGIEKLLNDQKYAEGLVKKGSGRLKNFSWKTAGRQTYKILKENGQ